MKVWVLMGSVAYEDSYLLGVFATQERAHREVLEREAKNSGDIDYYSVVECEVIE